MKDDKPKINFPYNHLEVLGFDELKPYKPESLSSNYLSELEDGYTPQAGAPSHYTSVTKALEQEQEVDKLIEELFKAESKPLRPISYIGQGKKLPDLSMREPVPEKHSNPWPLIILTWLAVLVVTVLLLSCAPRKPIYRPAPRAIKLDTTTRYSCVTSCGLKATMTVAQCDRLELAQNEILEAFAATSTISRDYMCMGLSGYKVTVHQRTKLDDDVCVYPSYVVWGQYCILGQTLKPTRTIELETDHFDKNSFAHEIGHALDFWIGFPLSEGHCGWAFRGWKQAIEQVTGIWDSTPEICSTSPVTVSKPQAGQNNN